MTAHPIKKKNQLASKHASGQTRTFGSKSPRRHERPARRLSQNECRAKTCECVARVKRWLERSSVQLPNSCHVSTPSVPKSSDHPRHIPEPSGKHSFKTFPRLPVPYAFKRRPLDWTPKLAPHRNSFWTQHEPEPGQRNLV